MKTTYYAYHPRNFGNEYTIIRVETPAEQEKLDAWYNKLQADPASYSFYRVTVEELQRMKAAERSARKHDKDFSGYCNPWEPVSVAGFLQCMDYYSA